MSTNVFKRVFFDQEKGKNLRFTFEGTGTQVLDDFLAKQDRIANKYEAERVRINQRGPNLFELNIFYSNPLAEGITPQEFWAELARPHTWEDVPVGIDEDGYIRRLNLRQNTKPHTLIGSSTGGGKSSLTNAVIAGVMTSEQGGNLVLIDPKQVEFAKWLPVASAHATTEDTMLATLEQLTSLVQLRYDWMKRRELESVWDDPVALVELGGPVFVVVDELAQLLMMAGKKAGQPIAELAQLGRACGVHLWLATQNPRAEMFGKANGTESLKANLGRRLALHTGTDSESNIILASGTERPESGASAARIPEDMPGTAVDSSGVMFRCPLIRKEFVDAVIPVCRPGPALDELVEIAAEKPDLSGFEKEGE